MNLQEMIIKERVKLLKKSGNMIYIPSLEQEWIKKQGYTQTVKMAGSKLNQNVY